MKASFRSWVNCFFNRLPGEAFFWDSKQDKLYLFVGMGSYLLLFLIFFSNQLHESRAIKQSGLSLLTNQRIQGGREVEFEPWMRGQNRRSALSVTSVRNPRLSQNLSGVFQCLSTTESYPIRWAYHLVHIMCWRTCNIYRLLLKRKCSNCPIVCVKDY